MVFYAIIILLIAYFWNKVNSILSSDSFSPFNILFFSWILPLLISTFKLSWLESTWKNSSISIVCWVTFCLIFASLLPFLILKKRYFNSRKHIFEQNLLIFQDKIMLNIILFFFAICFTLYLYSEFLTNPLGIPFIAALKGEMAGGSDFHRWGKDTKWSIITPMLFILTPMSYLVFKSNPNKIFRWVFLLIAILYPVMGLLKLSRSDIFIGALNIALVEYYFRKYRLLNNFTNRIFNKKKFILIIVSIFIAYGTLYLRSGVDSDGNIYAKEIEFKLDNTSFINETLAQIYGYLALPFENFHRFFEKYDGGFNPGISALRPFISVVGQGYIADKMIEEIAYEPISGAAGSATFLTLLYAELGICGLIIVPFIYGLMVNILYCNFRLKPNLINMFLYINFVYPWAWLFFNNAFSVLTFYINAFNVIFFYFLYNTLLIKKRFQLCIEK